MINLQEENNNDADCVQISSSNQNQQNNYLNDNELNVEANLAILQNRLLVTAASNKFGITLMKGEFLSFFITAFKNSNRTLQMFCGEIYSERYKCSRAVQMF